MTSSFAKLRTHVLGKEICAALYALLEDDSYLLEKDVNERSISHRLACHLQREFPTWHVDCEYNRDSTSTEPTPKKRLPSFHPQPLITDDTEGRTVFPDIIVHHRGTTENLLVIEIKKHPSSVSQDIDRKKLRAYRVDHGYESALFLVLATGATPALHLVEWIDA